MWWNRNIYRRRHRRTEPLLREVQFERDSLGRPLTLDPAVLLHPAEIRIAITDGGRSKRYCGPRLAQPAERSELDRTAEAGSA